MTEKSFIRADEVTEELAIRLIYLNKIRKKQRITTRFRVKLLQILQKVIY